MAISRTFIRLAYTGLFAVQLVAQAASPAPSLPAYGADPQQTSVSGLSSGAYMAVQMQVAYSGSVVGAGIIAGGPYNCAVSVNSALFVNICMGQVPLIKPDPQVMVKAAKNFAQAGTIDPLSNLGKRRIYVFSGTDDKIVRQSAGEATVNFFQQAGVPKESVQYVNTIPAGHALITPNFGNDCSVNGAPFISHCLVGNLGYDQAGALLQHIYGALSPRIDPPSGQIVSFNQRDFAADTTSMADTGYLYVPQSCTKAGSRCKVHVALHGCLQSQESVGNQFYTGTGYNSWADSNKILVLYPQVNKSQKPLNPQGCWDWWGYTGMNYAKKSGPQMAAIQSMVNRLTQQP